MWLASRQSPILSRFRSRTDSQGPFAPAALPAFITPTGLSDSSRGLQASAHHLVPRVAVAIRSARGLPRSALRPRRRAVPVTPVEPGCVFAEVCIRVLTSPFSWRLVLYDSDIGATFGFTRVRPLVSPIDNWPLASTGASRLCIGAPTSRVSTFHEVDTSFHWRTAAFVAHRKNNLPFATGRSVAMAAMLVR